MTKRRISASIDPDLLSAAEAAVNRRGSSNFSAWMAEHLSSRLRVPPFCGCTLHQSLPGGTLSLELC